MTGIAPIPQFHVVLVNLSRDLEEREHFFEHRVPSIGEMIRVNQDNTRYRVTSVESRLTNPVERGKFGPTHCFYEKLIVEVEEA
jgi:hypothetical protein